MAAEIRKKLGLEPKLIEGAGGIFDIKADGKLIFSKHDAGRFPEDHEVLDALSARAR